MQLKPRDQRPHVDEIIAQLRGQVASVPGIKVYPQNLPPIRIGGTLTKSLYQFTLQSPDTQELYRYADLMDGRCGICPSSRM
jgi:hydrophobic/amphiphilic exporter-1 (mainly G- bacteria), HAE1 family